MLSDEQLAALEATGIMKLEGAFAEHDAVRMRDVVWYELARRYEIDRDDPSTWDRHLPTGLKTAKKHSAFAPTIGPVLRSALDDLFGCEQWIAPKHYGRCW